VTEVEPDWWSLPLHLIEMELRVDEIAQRRAEQLEPIEHARKGTSYFGVLPGFLQLLQQHLVEDKRELRHETSTAESYLNIPKHPIAYNTGL